MAHGRLCVLRAIPGSTSLSPLVRRFCQPGQGIVTAFSDAVLPSCKDEVDLDSLVEVLSFGEVVRRLLELGGEEALRIAPNGHHLAAIAEACLQLPEESPFRRAARFPGFHQALLKTLKELNEWGLFSEEMEALAEQREDRLGDKLRSLALIDRESRTLLNRLGLETHARQMQMCLETTPERDGSYDRLLAIVGSEESPLKLRWLRWAAEQGMDLTVVLDRHATDGKVFAGAERAAKLLGVEPQEVGESNRLMQNLFAEKEHEGPSIEVTIASAADPLAECEWAIRRVAEAGPEGRASIYARNLEAYAPLIEASAKRFKVPIRLSRRAPLSTNSLARLTLTALEFVASSDVRTIGPLIQSSYLGLTGEQQAAVASALRECHRTRDLQWLTLRTWVEQHEGLFGWMLRLLEWRHENAGVARRLSEWTPRLRELIDDVLPVLNSAEVASDYSQERDRRARNQILRLLAGEASIANATERESIPLAEFVRTCRRLWETSDVSVPADDVGACVTGNPDCLEDADTVVVLGMLEGVFPRRRTEDPVLADMERKAISSLRPGEPELRTSRQVAEEERDAFYRVCARAKRKLVLSYPLADDTRDNVPAFYLELVRHAQGSVETANHPRSHVAPPIEACHTQADRDLRTALDGRREPPLPIEVSAEATLSRLRSEEKPVAPNELRDAHTCSFMYLSRHRLKLRPKRTAARWASLRQLPHAATLPKHATAQEAERALVDALESHLDSLYSEVPDWELQLMRSGGKRLIAEWVRREFASRRIWPKKDESVCVNVGFGTHGVRDSLWGGVKLEGVIPAISQIDELRVAHLFSRNSREPSRLTDNDRLFLGIYLASLFEAGKETAVEMETMAGQRTLYRLTRQGTRPLVSEVQSGLQVVDLSEIEDPVVAKKTFYEDVKRMVGQASARIRDGRVEVQVGDWCDWCDYGELCRRSRLFGEEDSPFGVDEETGDVA
ncbi:MAG TPA: PD-(D/E)XK nuclease family protein [Fimbriimonas sp.]